MKKKNNTLASIGGLETRMNPMESPEAAYTTKSRKTRNQKWKNPNARSITSSALSMESKSKDEDMRQRKSFDFVVIEKGKRIEQSTCHSSNGEDIGHTKSRKEKKRLRSFSNALEKMKSGIKQQKNNLKLIFLDRSQQKENKQVENGLTCSADFSQEKTQNEGSEGEKRKSVRRKSDPGGVVQLDSLGEQGQKVKRRGRKQPKYKTGTVSIDMDGTLRETSEVRTKSKSPSVKLKRKGKTNASTLKENAAVLPENSLNMLSLDLNMPGEQSASSEAKPVRKTKKTAKTKSPSAGKTKKKGRNETKSSKNKVDSLSDSTVTHFSSDLEKSLVVLEPEFGLKAKKAQPVTTAQPKSPWVGKTKKKGEKIPKSCTKMDNIPHLPSQAIHEENKASLSPIGYIEKEDPDIFRKDLFGEKSPPLATKLFLRDPEVGKKPPVTTIRTEGSSNIWEGKKRTMSTRPKTLQGFGVDTRNCDSEGKARAGISGEVPIEKADLTSANIVAKTTMGLTPTPLLLLVPPSMQDCKTHIACEATEHDEVVETKPQKTEIKARLARSTGTNMKNCSQPLLDVHQQARSVVGNACGVKKDSKGKAAKEGQQKNIIIASSVVLSDRKETSINALDNACEVEKGHEVLARIPAKKNIVTSALSLVGDNERRSSCVMGDVCDVEKRCDQNITKERISENSVLLSDGICTDQMFSSSDEKFDKVTIPDDYQDDVGNTIKHYNVLHAKGITQEHIQETGIWHRENFQHGSPFSKSKNPTMTKLKSFNKVGRTRITSTSENLDDRRGAYLESFVTPPRKKKISLTAVLASKRDAYMDSLVTPPRSQETEISVSSYTSAAFLQPIYRCPVSSPLPNGSNILTPNTVASSTPSEEKKSPSRRNYSVRSPKRAGRTKLSTIKNKSPAYSAPEDGDPDESTRGVKSPSSKSPEGSPSRKLKLEVYEDIVPRRRLSTGQSTESTPRGRLSMGQPQMSSPVRRLSTGHSPRRRLSAGLASKTIAFLEAAKSPARAIVENKQDSDSRSPRALKRGFIAINTSSRRRTSKSPTPPKRFMDGMHLGRDKAESYIQSATTLLVDPEKLKTVESLIGRIDELGGFPTTRRLSLRDNELVGQFVKAIRNDNTVTEIQVTPDFTDTDLFGTISSTLLNQFMHALRINLHINTLYLEGVELGNDFLYALATSMESNFVIQDINLSQNLFTSEGLANFCISLATNNNSVRSLNLASQTTPISEASEADVLAAFDQNTTLTFVDVDFVTEEGKTRLASILERNRKLAAKTTIDAAKNVDDKLIEVLTFEAERAQEAWDQRAEEENIKDIDEEDWEYLYQLSLLFDKHKLKKEVEQNTAMGTGIDPTTRRKNADDLNREEKKEFLFGAFQKTMEESFMAFKEDGSFLTSEFISKYLLERTDADEEGIGLDFDFHGQWKLFKRFPPHDPARKLIVDKFVDAIVSHPRANELTGINMANTGMGDDFAIALSARCLKDSSLLPNLHTVNFETNYVNEVGVVALSQLVAARDCCKYIQVIRLENQKDMLKSKAEFALAKALRVNRSVVVVSLTMRNLLEKERMVKYIMRNVDLLRQARQQHMKNIGTQRKRNKVEAFFDKILQNDPAITKVDMGGNERFLTLTKTEKIRAAASFAHNTHVIDVVLNGCGIDDDFAKALGEAMKTNLSIERLHLESNDISGEGIKALFHGLGDNCNLRELRLHNQSKVLASVDEDLLAGLLEENTTLTKVGVDLRSMLARNKLDRKVAMNKNFEFKMKAAAKGDEFISNESYSFIRF